MGALASPAIRRAGSRLSTAAPLDQAPTTIPSGISEALVLLYRGWHRFEQLHGGPSIVDFDLSDLRGHEELSSREEILGRLNALHDELLSDASEEGEFLRARLGGSSAYLRALMGEQIDFPTYLVQTLGLMPGLIPDAELASARYDAELSLSALNLAYDPDGLKAYEARRLRNPSDIENEIVSDKDIWLERLRNSGIRVPPLMPLAVKFDKVDAYWSNWIDGSLQHGITLTINLHERVRYDRGRALFLCLHELCGHAVQMSTWRQRIQHGTLSQACGVTNVHSPEMLLAEGLAQCVPDLFDPSLFSDEFQVGRALRYHTSLELHNAHLRMYEGVNFEDLLEHLTKALPFTRREELRPRLAERRDNPLYRTYLLSYSVGERALRSMIRAAGDAKVNLFERLYGSPIIPRKLLQLPAESAR